MTVLLILMLFVSAIELAIYSLRSAVSRKFVAVFIAITLFGLSVGLIVDSPSTWTILVGFFSLFRIVNLIRVIDGRKQMDYLRVVFTRSSRHLITYQLIVILITYLVELIDLGQHTKWTTLAGAQLAVALLVLFSTRRNLIKTRPQVSDEHLPDSALPDVTVAIPARNETTELDELLSSLIRSNYPKLEILVLDDCSQNKQTPEIIKQFAHDGVRFLAGEQPPQSWSAKNYAYEQLAEAANGKLILFCGVDVRFAPDSIKQMVELMQSKRKTIVSFIPKNSSSGLGVIKLLSIQPWRYFWELGLPRRSLNRPPVLSTCWLIDKASLKADGGFKAVSRDVLPERYFAREAVKHNDGYSFIQSGDMIGLECVKGYPEQYQTAIRTRYPVLKQRLELTALLSLAELVVLVSPVILLVIYLTQRNWVLVIVSGLSTIILNYCFFRVVNLTYKKVIFSSLLIMPILALHDIYLLLYSMWQYEFSEVVWKGRNVCIPVMHSIPSLPAIDNQA